MNEHPEDIPVACSLTDAEFRERERTMLARFIAAVVMKEEFGDGYEFRVRGDDDAIVAVAELIAAERKCCRFLRFELIASSNMGPVVLRVTGPTGTKDFLETILSTSKSPCSYADSVRSLSPLDGYSQRCQLSAPQRVRCQ
jgi:hypothetical protein